MKKYDTETYVYYRVEFSRAEEVAELGEWADTVETTINADKFNEELIELYATQNSYDTVEITKVTEETKRYTV